MGGHTISEGGVLSPLSSLLSPLSHSSSFFSSIPCMLCFRSFFNSWKCENYQTIHEPVHPAATNSRALQPVIINIIITAFHTYVCTCNFTHQTLLLLSSTLCSFFFNLDLFRSRKAKWTTGSKTNIWIMAQGWPRYSPKCAQEEQHIKSLYPFHLIQITNLKHLMTR